MCARDRADYPSLTIGRVEYERKPGDLRYGFRLNMSLSYARQAPKLLLTGLILVIFFITLVKFFMQDPFVGVIASCFKFR
jgi:hypothetical protein